MKDSVIAARKKEIYDFRIRQKGFVTCYQRLFNRLDTFTISAHSGIIVYMSSRCSVVVFQWLADYKKLLISLQLRKEQILQ